MRPGKLARVVGTASALGLLAVATVATAVIRRAHPADPPRPIGAAASALSPAAPAPGGSAQQQLLKGERSEYRFELSANTVQSSGGELQQGVRGNLTIISSLAEANRELWEISDLEISGSKNGQALETQLAQPGARCVVVRSATGAPLKLTFDRDVAVEQRQRLEQLVAIAQSGGAPTGTQNWSEHEVDGTGTYLAEYTRLATGDLKRTKRAYESDGPRAVGLRIVLSEAALRFEEGHIVSVHDHQQLEMQQGALKINAKASLERTLADVPVTLEPARLLDAGVSYEFGRASLVSDAERDRASVRGLTFSDGVASLASAPSDDARGQAARRLGALFRLQPELANEAASAVDGLPEPAVLALISSLAESRCSAGGRVLNTLATSANRSHSVRLTALEGLSRAGLPLEVVVPALQSALNDPLLQSSAALNLGIVAFEGREVAPALAASGRESLVEQYRRGGERSSLFIAALGNAGAPELLPAIRKLAKEPDANLRGELIWASRKLTDEDVGRAVAWALSKEQSPLVRRRALQVCSRWPRERACPDLEHVALHDADPVTRQQGLRALWSRAHSDPERADLLRVARLATHDTDAKTRQLAESLIAQLQNGATGQAAGMIFGSGVQ